jgi:archaemetzincin
MERATRWIPPTPAERLAAIGPTAALPPSLRQALEPGDAFAPIPAPEPSDWLANHPEAGQTFAQFVRAGYNQPDPRRHTVYLQPLGTFAPDDSPPLDQLQLFAAAFFALDIVLLPALDIAASPITARQNPHTRRTQLLTSDILALLRRHLPDNAYAVLGITMTDLYPDPAWNFVFGQASLRERVGVYSFARYDPRFFGAVAPDEWQQLMLRRSCKVLVHETAHMFGIAHCIYFHCLMNGSNHLAESDARPMHLCPVDLRKLQHSVGFDVVARYQRLHEVCVRLGFSDEARWLRERWATIVPS